MSLPTLQTERLLLREYRADDLEARHQLLTQAFQESASLDDTRAWLDWTLHSYREFARLHQPPYGDYAVALRDSGTVIGSVGLVPSVIPWGVFEPNPQPPYPVSPEFGLYWGMLPAYWGQGYAVEAVRPFMGFLFETLQVRRLVATTEHSNLNSQRVMQKLGMQVQRNPIGEPFWFEVLGVLEASNRGRA